MQKRVKKDIGKQGYLIELTVILILTVSLLTLGWGFIYKESNKYRQNAVEALSANQEILVRQIAREAKSNLESYIISGGLNRLEAENNAAQNIMGNAEASGSRYWFFYAKDRIIYEKSREETEGNKDKSLKELSEYWRLHGGKNIDDFLSMISNGTSGSLVFSKDGKIGEEIVSHEIFTVGGVQYCIGTATKKSYLMAAAGTNDHILYLRIFAGIVSLDILLLSLLLCLKSYRNHRDVRSLKGDITDKNLQIQELTGKLELKSEAVENVSVYDSLTKLYNRKFFETLLVRIKDNLQPPVSFVVLDINGLEYLNSVKGYAAGDILIQNVTEIINKTCIDTDIVARTGSSEFTILMISTKLAQAYGAAENINRRFNGIDNGGLTLSIGAAQIKNKSDSIELILQTAKKNMILAKMLDKNSSSSSIISMLMETLSAFSKESVEHSKRLCTMARVFGEYLGLSPSEINRLAVAAQLHDVGKVGIPDSILNKPQSLEEFEKELMRRHPEIGYNIVKSIPFLDEVAIDVLHHHEHYEGNGYPAGLKGGEITLNGRIISILDSFDIMTHKRVYAKTKTVKEAMADLLSKSGSQYDPYLVEEFVKVVSNRIAKASAPK